MYTLSFYLILFHLGTARPLISIVGSKLMLYMCGLTDGDPEFTGFTPACSVNAKHVAPWPRLINRTALRVIAESHELVLFLGLLLLDMYASCQAKIFEYLFEISFEALRKLAVNGHRKLYPDLEVRTAAQLR